MAKSSAVQICLANLGFLDRGSAQLMIDRDLQSAHDDCDDRGEQDGKERVVVIKVRLSKLKSGMVEAVCESQFTPPISRTNPTACQTRRDYQTKKNVLEFQPLSPGNPNQEELPYKDGARDESEVN